MVKQKYIWSLNKKIYFLPQSAKRPMIVAGMDLLSRPDGDAAHAALIKLSQQVS